MSSLIESLRESLADSRRRATGAHSIRRRGSWIWGVGLVLAAATLALASPAGAVLPIDDFSSGQNLELLSGEVSVSGVAPAPAAIGGERDLAIERVSGSGTADVDVNGGGQGQLTFSTSFDTETTLRLVWDGADSDAEQIDFAGLGSVDLSDGGLLDAFAIELASDLDTALSLRVYDASDANGEIWSGVTVPVLGMGNQLEILEILFAEFTEIGPNGAADFTNVGAISLAVDGIQTLDFRMNNVQVVPEPVGASLAGLVALALLAHHRRRGGR